MQNIESTALAFFTAIRGYDWILVVAGLLAVGGIALWGKQSWKDAVKDRMAGIIIGAVVMLGAVEIGKWICEMITF